MLKTVNLSLRLSDCDLRDINLDVIKGECLCIMGPTGAGKTVLVETIAGIRKQDKGRIILNGKDISHLPPYLRDIAYVPQDAVLFPHMSVADNVAYGLVERQLAPDVITERVNHSTTLLGVNHLLHRRPATLSGGEAQRVALARALVLQTDLLLLDEPFAAVDERNREKLGAQVRILLQELGITAIHVSHSLDEVFGVADRICVLNTGQIMQVASPDELLRKPDNEFIARFTGCRNIIEGKVQRNGKGMEFKTENIKFYVPGEQEGAAQMVIRPEEILLHTDEITGKQNLHQAEVTQVINQGAIMKTHVQIENIEWIVITSRREAEALGLVEGLKVYAQFPVDAIHLIY